MKYSLISIDAEHKGFVSGTWLQNHIGTLESATKAAIDTENANSNRIKVAVVNDLGEVIPVGHVVMATKRLDNRKVYEIVSLTRKYTREILNEGKYISGTQDDIYCLERDVLEKIPNSRKYLHFITDFVSSEYNLWKMETR